MLIYYSQPLSLPRDGVGVVEELVVIVLFIIMGEESEESGYPCRCAGGIGRDFFLLQFQHEDAV